MSSAPSHFSASNPYFQRRTHCRNGHRLWGRNILHARQTDGRISRLCRRCFLARRLVYQRQYRERLAQQQGT